MFRFQKESTESLTVFYNLLKSHEDSIQDFYRFFHQLKNKDEEQILQYAHDCFKKCVEELWIKFSEHFVSSLDINQVETQFQDYS